MREMLPVAHMGNLFNFAHHSIAIETARCKTKACVWPPVEGMGLCAHCLKDLTLEVSPIPAIDLLEIIPRAGKIDRGYVRA
jgi:hypothetical protein